MNRRGFLMSFIAVPVAAAASPALVELLEPKRVIFLPPSGGWLSNRLIPPHELSEMMLEDIGSLYAQALAKSLIETKQTLITNILNGSFVQ